MPGTPITAVSPLPPSRGLRPELGCSSHEYSKDQGPGSRAGDTPRLLPAALGPSPRSFTEQRTCRKQKLRELWVSSQEWKGCGFRRVSA